jgi:Excalibur calcium-binding domain
MSTFPPPAGGPPPLPAPSVSSPWRKVRRWPLWAKIAAPIGGLVLAGGVANAVGSESPHDDSAVAVTIDTETSAPSATDEPIVVTTLASEVTAAMEVTEATTGTAGSSPVPAAPSPVASDALPAISPAAPPTVPPTQPPPPAPIQPAANSPLSDPRFDTCKEAKANGYGPYFQGTDTEYGWYQDRDNDGIVCE